MELNFHPKRWQAGLAIAAVVLAAWLAFEWLATPSRYFTAAELERVAMPVTDVGLEFPPGREGIDYYGTLRMEVYIDEHGHVDRVEVLESTVPAAFMASAVAKFRAATFAPAERRGRPVKSVKKVEVRFQAPLSGLERER